jgi:hypothetical protein
MHAAASRLREESGFRVDIEDIECIVVVVLGRGWSECPAYV